MSLTITRQKTNQTVLIIFVSVESTKLAANGANFQSGLS